MISKPLTRRTTRAPLITHQFDIRVYNIPYLYFSIVHYVRRHWAPVEPATTKFYEYERSTEHRTHSLDIKGIYHALICAQYTIALICAIVYWAHSTLICAIGHLYVPNYSNIVNWDRSTRLSSLLKLFKDDTSNIQEALLLQRNRTTRYVSWNIMAVFWLSYWEEALLIHRNHASTLSVGIV